MGKKIDGNSLLQARLCYGDRPIHIYFPPGNNQADAILTQPDGSYAMHYNNRGVDLPLHGNGAPALYYEDGSQAFFEYGRLHRWGGPAVEDTATGTVQYWLNGIHLLPEEYLECKEYDIWPISWSPEGQIIWVKRTDPYCKHRVLGPAKVTFSGKEEYYYDGTRVEKTSDLRDNAPILIGALAIAGALSIWQSKSNKAKPQNVHH